MIKENQKRLNNLAVILDAVVAVAAYLAAYFLVFKIQIFSFITGPITGGYSLQQYLMALYFLIPALLCVYWVLRLYMPKRVTQSAREVSSIIQANLIVMLSFSLILFMGKEKLRDFSRPVMALFFVINTFADVLFRYCVRRVLRLFRRKGYNQKHVLFGRLQPCRFWIY